MTRLSWHRVNVYHVGRFKNQALFSPWGHPWAPWQAAHLFVMIGHVVRAFNQTPRGVEYNKPALCVLFEIIFLHVFAVVESVIHNDGGRGGWKTKGFPVGRGSRWHVLTIVERWPPTTPHRSRLSVCVLLVGFAVVAAASAPGLFVFLIRILRLALFLDAGANESGAPNRQSQFYFPICDHDADVEFQIDGIDNEDDEIASCRARLGVRCGILDCPR